MGQESGTGVSAAAKKGIVLFFLVVVVGILLMFVFSKEGSKGTRIIKEGDRAPDFTLQTVDGRRVSLSSMRGKVVMVHFWATWCPPCVEEIPILDKLYRSMFNKDFELLAISVDEGGAAAVSSFLDRNRLTLPVLLDPDHEVASRYGTFKFPETYILDKNGIVKFKVIGARNWMDPGTIKALQELAAAK